MFENMEKWTKIRLDVLQGDVSKREILRREGIHWDTLKKILTHHPEPPGYQEYQSLCLMGERKISAEVIDCDLLAKVKIDIFYRKKTTMIGKQYTASQSIRVCFPILKK